MSGSGKAGSGRGNNKRRHFKRHGDKKSRERWQEESHKQQQVILKNTETAKVEKPVVIERPKWVPPPLDTSPLPVPDCPYCGKPIREISQAIADKDSGKPVHFDCITSRITNSELLESGESLSYIGGGRFAIGTMGPRLEFKIKKIIEWENKDKRAEWRSEICDHYSVI